MMNRVKGFLWPRATGDLFKCGRSWHLSVNKHESGLVDAETVRLFEFQPQRGGATAGTLQQDGLNYGDRDLGEIFNVSRKVLWRSKLPCCYEENDLGQKEYSMNFSRQYSSGAENNPALNRDFLVKLWVADRKMKKSKAKRKKIIPSPANRVKPVLKPPPPSQPVIGSLEPASLDEAQVATLLARSTLLITRDIEWANLMLGFEQENRYAIVDVCYPQSPVGLIREQSNLIARQLLRTRRPFVAYITDSLGNELFRVRRPFWWINSSIYAEINGKEVGVVHRRWHLWKRIYDLYLGNEQFAVVENPGFWNWTFSLKDIDGKLLAQIDRDWRGFGFEIFTDAGQYVIRFGSADTGSRSGPADLIQELEVVRPLTLSERAVTVALAVSLDNDYFSRHGGWGIPFFAIEE